MNITTNNPTMSKKITVKQAKEFNDKFCKGLIELGAKSIEPMTDSFISFEIPTIVGKLSINVPIQQTYCFMIFSRFEDVDKAKLKFDCNPFSGKYNFSQGIYDKQTVADIVERAIMMFECTLPNTK